MVEQRAKTYLWLFLAMSASVFANMLYFQDHARQADNRALRVAAPAEKAALQLSETVRAIQRELRDLKLYPGQPDGKLSPLVTAAIMAYEQAQTLPITGEPTQALLRELIVGPSGELGKGVHSAMDVAPGSAGEKLINDVRGKLASLGYAVGSVQGRMTAELMQGIRAFEKDNNVPQSGRISAELILQLQRSTAAFKRAG